MTLAEDSQNVTIVTLEYSYHPCSAASDLGGDTEVHSVERHKNPHGVIFGNILPGACLIWGGLVTGL